MCTSRHLTGVLLSLVVMTGCRPASVTVSSLTHPPDPPSPVADVVTQPPPAPVVPMAAPPATPATEIHLAVDFPPGTWQRLQKPFKTQADVSPQDLPSQAVKTLRLTINGQETPADQWSVERLQWTAEGGILATLKILQPLVDRPSDITLGNATRSLYLRLKTDKPQTATLSVASTALAFLSVAMGGNALPQQLPGYVVDAVSRRLLNLLIRSEDTAITTDPALLSLLKGLASALLSGKIPSPSDVAAIEQNAGIGGSKGGTSTTAKPVVVAPPAATGPLTEATSVQQGAASTAPLTIGPLQAACQTFTAPGTGVCVGFEVDVASGMTAPTPQLGADGSTTFLGLPMPAMVKLSLFPTSGGWPTDTPLATSYALAPPGGGFISGQSIAVPVTGGQTYAIVVEPQDGASATVAATMGDPYGQGEALTYNGGWSAAGNRDLRFRVNLTP